jgi:hypothetical protein
MTNISFKTQFWLFTISIVPIINAFAAPSAIEIARNTDKIRNPDHPFVAELKLSEYNDGKLRDNYSVLRIHSKRESTNGQYRSLVQFLEPSRDKGKLMLRHGFDIWFDDPDAKNSIRISPQQRMLGQASNGDIMTTDFTLDYNVSLAGEETVQDTKRQDRATWKLHMTRVDPEVTYHSIDYWVDKDNYRPVKGKFYAESGKLLKIAYFKKFQMYLGEYRPTEVLIIDGVDTSKVTRMEFRDFNYIDIPESWFQRSYLPRFNSAQ